MVKQSSYKYWLWIALAAAGCSSGGNSPEDGVTGMQMQALLADNDTDVASMKYVVQAVSCEDGSAIGDPITEVRPLEAEAIPGGNPELQNAPLDDGSSHVAADLFVVVAAGCYDVTTKPRTENGKASAECAEAVKRGIVVAEGQTTEVMLLNQCEGTDPGALDVISALNREPTLDDVSFTDSKLVCGSPVEICIQGSDPDNDPVELVLLAPECDVTPVGYDKPGTQCWEVACHDFGRAKMTALVYDQLWDDGKLVRIEDWLTEQGYPNESHAQLDFFAYFDGVKLYADQDGDGHGDAQAEATMLCFDDDTAGYVITNDDCDDGSLGTYPGAADICGDNIDNDCDGQVDEDCCTRPWVCDGSMTIEICKTCDNGGNSYCFKRVDGEGLCTDDFACAGKTTCVADGDCATGQVCIVDSCCGVGTCVTPKLECTIEMMSTDVDATKGSGAKKAE